jgi:hypothetical protein
MNNKRVIFVAVSVLFIVSIYASSFRLTVFVEARKTVVEIDCSPQDGGKTRCCGSEVDDKLLLYGGYTGVVYCTTCDDTQPPSNCTPREKVERVQDSPRDVLTKDLNVKGDKTTNDTTIPKDFDLKKGDLLTNDNQITTNKESSPTPPPCPEKGPIPPDCTMKPLLK